MLDLDSAYRTPLPTAHTPPTTDAWVNALPPNCRDRVREIYKHNENLRKENEMLKERIEKLLSSDRRKPQFKVSRSENALESFQRKTRSLAFELGVPEATVKQALIKCKHDPEKAKEYLNMLDPVTLPPNSPPTHVDLYPQCHNQLSYKLRQSPRFHPKLPADSGYGVPDFYDHSPPHGPMYEQVPNKSPYAICRDAFGPEYNTFYATFSSYKDKISRHELWPRKEKRDLGGFTEYAKEILRGVKAKDVMSPLTFLDLGAAPGGMASALFDTFYGRKLRGFGVSLPSSEGGFPVSFTNRDYNVVYRDCTDGPAKGRPDALAHVPFVDLVVCDTTVMGFDKKTNFRADIYVLKQELLSRSLGASFRKLRRGGCLLIRLQMQPSLFSLRIHAFLFEHFEEFSSVKPLKLFHMSREYYLLCQGFKREPYDPTLKLVKWAHIDANENPAEAMRERKVAMSLTSHYRNRMVTLLRHCWKASHDFLTARLVNAAC